MTALPKWIENWNRDTSEGNPVRDLTEALAIAWEALERLSDKNNWGYLDPSGCPKGIGEHVESWVREDDPVVIGNNAMRRIEKLGEETK